MEEEEEEVPGGGVLVEHLPKGGTSSALDSNHIPVAPLNTFTYYYTFHGQRVGYTKTGPRASPNRITQNHVSEDRKIAQETRVQQSLAYPSKSLRFRFVSRRADFGDHNHRPKTQPPTGTRVQLCFRGATSASHKPRAYSIALPGKSAAARWGAARSRHVCRRQRCGGRVDPQSRPGKLLAPLEPKFYFRLYWEAA